MTRKNRPAIGVTLDAEPPGGYAKSPWYALRANYIDAIVGAGGLPILLPHDPGLVDAYLDRLDALVVTGGAFDVDPGLYGDATTHGSVSLKQDRTTAELALLRGALAKDLPVLGICGGEQLLAVALGGTLIQHIPDHDPAALAHEQTHPHDRPGHSVTLQPGTVLARIVGQEVMQVNTSHHQAVRDPGPDLVVNAIAPDGIIEGIEDPTRRYCLGVQWHPEYGVDAGDRRILDALVAACA